MPDIESLGMNWTLTQCVLLMGTTLYQAIAGWLDDRIPPPGQRLDVGGYCLHYCVAGEHGPTIVLDHSLGGLEGYLLIHKIAKLGRVLIYDRAGYGWSDHSPHPRTSQQIVAELDTLLTRSGLQPPYILVGDSFGSYNMRLYAHCFPQKVVGLVLTDGLHESGMLKMPWSLRAVQLFFLSGFVMSILGSILGIVRLLRAVGLFEVIKPELRRSPRQHLMPITRSFCRPKHWITMSRELVSLKTSGQQVSAARDLGDLPLVSIQSQAFFHASLLTVALPLRAMDRLREQMHPQLLQLSTRSAQLQGDRSSHFVWTDQPEVILNAIQIILKTIRS